MFTPNISLVHAQTTLQVLKIFVQFHHLSIEMTCIEMTFCFEMTGFEMTGFSIKAARPEIGFCTLC